MNTEKREEKLFNIERNSRRRNMVYCPNCGAKNPDGKLFCADCRTELGPPELDRQSYGPTSGGQRSMFQLRINILCIAGAVLAVLALFLPWGVMEAEGTDDVTNLGPFDFKDAEDGGRSFPSNLRYSVTIFLVGAILAFVITLGGLLQFIGSTAFLLTASTSTIEGANFTYWGGAVFGLAASFLVLFSIVAPLGVGYDKGEIGPLSRLLSVSAYRQQ